MSGSSEQEASSVARLRQMGEKEPIAAFLESTILELCPGYARVSMKMKREYLNMNGMVFGGMVMAVADHAFGLAVNTIAHPSIASQFNVYLMSRVEADDTLTAECRMIKNGKRLGISEISVTNQRGDVVAKATGTTIPVGKDR